MDDAGAPVKVTQISTEPAENTEPVDPCVRTQMGHALDPALDQVAGEGLARFEFADQKAVQIEQDLLAAESTAGTRVVRFEEGLEPRGQRTTKEAGGHGISPSPARAWPLAEACRDPLWRR